MNTEIRDATQADISAIYAVDQMAVGEGHTIVFTVDSVVVGYAVLEYTFFGCGFITMLMVDKAIRRKGVATALISEFENRCKTDKLFTSTNESNKPMQALMLSMSYEPSGIVYNLDEGDPELFYVKRLEGSH